MATSPTTSPSFSDIILDTNTSEPCGWEMVVVSIAIPSGNLRRAYWTWADGPPQRAPTLEGMVAG